MQAIHYEKITSMTGATALSASIYNPSTHLPFKLMPESLTNGVLTAGASWDEAGDFSEAANTVIYEHSAGAGTFTQAVTALARTGKSGISGVGSGGRYRFTYTVSAPANTAPTITITTAFAKTATALVGLDTAGTYYVDFTAADIPGAFILSGVSAAAGKCTLDSLSLKEIVPQHQQIKRALITCRTAAVNFRYDGSTPTTDAGTDQGHYLGVNDVVTLNDIGDIRNFRAVNAVAQSGSILNVTYYVV